MTIALASKCVDAEALGTAGKIADSNYNILLIVLIVVVLVGTLMVLRIKIWRVQSRTKEEQWGA